MVISKIISYRDNERCIDYVIEELIKTFGEKYFNFKKVYTLEYVECNISTYKKCDLNFIEDKIYKLISEVILLFYKEKYVKNLLIKYSMGTSSKLNVSNRIYNIFVKSLVLFEFDIYIRLLNADLKRDKIINLEGIYNFKINYLKYIWKDDIFMFLKRQDVILKIQEAFLLKNLINIRFKRGNVLNVNYDKDKYIFKDEFNCIKNIPEILVLDLDDVEKIVVCSIYLGYRDISLNIPESIKKEVESIFNEILL